MVQLLTEKSGDWCKNDRASLVVGWRGDNLS